jgi:hypothetical protein
MSGRDWSGLEFWVKRDDASDRDRTIPDALTSFKSEPFMRDPAAIVAYRFGGMRSNPKRWTQIQQSETLDTPSRVWIAKETLVKMKINPQSNLTVP